MLQNRFYLGELPDGNDGWLPSAHQPVLDAELFEQAQAARQANETEAAKVRRGHRRCSLTGLAVCCHCGGRLHFNTAPNGRARFYCYQGRQATSCEQRSGMLNPIEEQLATYLTTFPLPEDMVQQLITLYEQATAQRDDTVRHRRELSA